MRPHYTIPCSKNLIRNHYLVSCSKNLMRPHYTVVQNTSCNHRTISPVQKTAFDHTTLSHVQKTSCDHTIRFRKPISTTLALSPVQKTSCNHTTLFPVQKAWCVHSNISTTPYRINVSISFYNTRKYSKSTRDKAAANRWSPVSSRQSNTITIESVKRPEIWCRGFLIPVLHSEKYTAATTY